MKGQAGPSDDLAQHRLVRERLLPRGAGGEIHAEELGHVSASDRHGCLLSGPSSLRRTLSESWGGLLR